MKITILLFALISLSSYAETKPKNKMMPMMEATKEQRDNMAKIHEKMAECLRSDKTLQDCHAEMKNSCHESMGNDACQMHSMEKLMKMKK